MLLRAFRQDKPLALLTLLMACVSLAPLAATTILPFIDLPIHAALSRMLWDAAFGGGSASQYFFIDPSPSPYWMAYVLLAVSIRIFGAFLGTKVAVAFCMLTIPLGMMRLLLAFGKSPRIGVLAFLMMWDFNLTFGWLNQVLGTGLVFFALAALIEAKTPQKALRVWPYGILLGLTHVLPFGFFGLAAVFVTLVRPGSRWLAIKVFGAAIFAPSLVLVPWLARSLQSGARGDPGFVFDPIQVKIESLLDHSLGYAHIDPNARLSALAAVVAVILLPLGVAFFPKKLVTQPLKVAAVPFLTAFILYLVLPLGVARPVEHWGTYPRFCTPALLGLLLLPSPKLANRHLWFAAIGVVTSVVLSAFLVVQFRAFDVAVAPFYEVTQKIPVGAKVLPLCYQNRYPMVRPLMGESLHAYIAAEAGAFDPYLFWLPTIPVQRKQSRVPPSPPGWGRNPRTFSMRAHGQFYDYILVQGTSSDPVREQQNTVAKVELVFEREPFRLYAVHK